MLSKKNSKTMEAEAINSYIIINLKRPQAKEISGLTWEKAVSLCLELNEKARQSGEMPEKWESLYVIGRSS